jgi:sugar phosphate isomerase/epimerase
MPPSLGTTLYSLTPEFHARQHSFIGLVDEVGRRGLGPGLEIVGFQSIKGYPALPRELERDFKNALESHDLQPSCLGANVDAGRVPGKLATEDELVAYMEPQLEAAARLGFPVIRMQWAATPPVIERLVPTAERLGVVMGMEVHSPHTVHHPVMVALRELYERLDTPVVGFIPDFGASVVRQPPMLFEAFAAAGVPERGVTAMVEAWNAQGDPFGREHGLYDRLVEERIEPAHISLLMKGMGLFGRQDPRAWREIGDDIVHVHGKFFEFDASGNEPAVPYAELIEVLSDVGYDGFISSEWEGWHWIDGRDGFAVLAQHHALLRRLIDAS